MFHHRCPAQGLVRPYDCHSRWCVDFGNAETGHNVWQPVQVPVLPLVGIVFTFLMASFVKTYPGFANLHSDWLTPEFLNAFPFAVGEREDDFNFERELPAAWEIFGY